MLLALTLALATAAPPAAAALDVDDPVALVRKYDQIMSPENFESQTQMIAHREDGTVRTYEMRVQKSGRDKVRATFEAPSSAKGQEMLRNGENMWLWMPNLKRTMRVASRDTFMGGDFNNADVLRVNYEADYVPTIGSSDNPDQVCLQLKAKSAQVAWDLIKLYVNKKDGMPVRAEFYAASGKILRSAEFSDVKDYGKGLVRPSKIVMRNELQKGRFSEMTWTRIDVKDSISPQRFVVDDLGR